jgi:type VI secretion system protein ImpF
LADSTGAESVVHLPTRYVGSEDSTDDNVRLGRATEWADVEGLVFRGSGQNTFEYAAQGAGVEEIPLLEIRTLEVHGSGPVPMPDGDLDGLRPSILDRLVGGDTGSAAIREVRVSMAEIKSSVRRDIEWLLNSRQFLSRELEGFPEAKRSVLSYGLPDLSVYSPARLADNERICQLITELLETFEPRFMKREDALRAGRSPVRVTRVDAPRDHRATSVFRIAATLYIEPLAEEVVFDTKVEFDSGSVEVNEAD